MRSLSENGLAILKKFEGLCLSAYRCPAGIPTIGYGSTRYPDGNPVCINDSIDSEAKASEILCYTLLDFEKVVNAHLPNLRQAQFDALVLFTYNIGIAAFTSSTLLKRAKLNSSDPRISDEFLRWNRAGGIVLAGLQTRRIEEARLYFSFNNYSI
jgi:lysozyme